MLSIYWFDIRQYTQLYTNTTFLIGKQYLVRLKAGYSLKSITDGLGGFSQYLIEVNAPPVITAASKCTVKPLSGDAMTTKYTLTCEGIADEDKPLTYECFYVAGIQAKDYKNCTSCWKPCTFPFSGK